MTATKAEKSRQYEIILVFNTRDKKESLDDLIQVVREKIESYEASVSSIEKLGRKQFVYNARKLEAGEYVKLEVEAKPEFPKEINQYFKLNSSVHLSYIQKK